MRDLRVCLTCHRRVTVIAAALVSLALFGGMQAVADEVGTETEGDSTPIEVVSEVATQQNDAIESDQDAGNNGQDSYSDDRQMVEGVRYVNTEGTVADAPACMPLADALACTPLDASSAGTTLPDTGTFTPRGGYGSSIAKDVAGVKLAQGWYYLSGSDLKLDRPVEVDGEVNIVLDGTLHMGRDAKLCVAEGATLRLCAAASPEGTATKAVVDGEGRAYELVENRGLTEVCDVTLTGANDVAVYNAAGSEFHLVRGSVCDSGAGICGDDGSFTRIDGGRVERNRDGGVSGGDLAVSGAAVVRDNTRFDVLLSDGRPIKVEGPLDEDASIGVKLSEDSSSAFSSGFGEHNGEADPAKLFFVNGGQKLVCKDGEACVSEEQEAKESQEESGSEAIEYLDRWGKKQNTGKEKVTDISDSSFSVKKGYSLGDGWYVVKKSRDFDKRLNIDGDVKLILCDGVKANFKDGIHGKSGKLAIYAQSTGKDMGRLIAKADGGEAAGIGGNNDESNNTEIEIYGGKIEAKGDCFGAGIGGGDHGGAGKISIYGGDVEAEGGKEPWWSPDLGGGAGIGSGDAAKKGGIVAIYGGIVNAKGPHYAAGIGTGDEAKEDVEVFIYGGTVTARGGSDAAGIGGGNESGAHVHIDNGIIDAKGGDYGAGIGTGDEYHAFTDDGDVEENFGRWEGIETHPSLTERSYTVAKALVEIRGGNVTAKGGTDAAGIGGGNESACRVKIHGGTINATGGKYGAGIGTGDESDEFFVPSLTSSHGYGVVIVSDGEVTATGGYKAAGIGGGNETPGGFILITGGKITAKGKGSTSVESAGGAGIGGGDECSSGRIRILGGRITASSTGKGTRAIGGGKGDSSDCLFEKWWNGVDQPYIEIDHRLGLYDKDDARIDDDDWDEALEDESWLQIW